MSNNHPTEYSLQELENLSADKTVDPPILRRGLVGKASDGSWYNIAVNPDGSLIIDSRENTGIQGGPVAVGTTEVELIFTGVTQSILVQSDPDNTGKVWLGLTGITSSGGNAFAQLEPGSSMSLEYNDATASLYVISDSASQNVFRMALT